MDNNQALWPYQKWLINIHSNKETQPAPMMRDESHPDALVNLRTGVHASEDIQNYLLVAVGLHKCDDFLTGVLSKYDTKRLELCSCAQEQTLENIINV